MITEKTEMLERRREALIDAARTLFVQQGFSGTPLSQIVALAGGSLATVYKLFENKDGLLDAVVTVQTRSGVAIIDEEIARGGGPADMLDRIGTRLYERFLNPQDVALARIVIAHSIEKPEFARKFFETTALRTRRALQALISGWMEEGAMGKGDPALLAEIYHGLVIGDLQNEAISHGAVRYCSLDRIRERTAFFLRGAQVRDPAAGG